MKHPLWISGQALPFELAVEAVLHVMDGSNVLIVAEKYGISVGHLSHMVYGRRRPDISDAAVLLYSEYRKVQKAESASLIKG